MAKQLAKCKYSAVESSTKTVVEQLEDGLKRFHDPNGDEARAAHDCAIALTLVCHELKEMIETIDPSSSHSAQPRVGAQHAVPADKVKLAIAEAKSILASIPFAKRAHSVNGMLLVYQRAFALLVDAAPSVRKLDLVAYFSMAGEILHKAARLCGAVNNQLLPNAAELQVVALVISEYVLGPATRKSLEGRNCVSRTYYEAAKARALAKDTAGTKSNIRLAKKYGADAVHAARFIAGFVSNETLSALRLYLKVQFMRYQVEKYTDEDWDFNVLHEWYTYLLEELKFSR